MGCRGRMMSEKRYNSSQRCHSWKLEVELLQCNELIIMGYLEVMQVCRNGHIINYKVRSAPEFSRPNCVQCGESTIDQCPSCNTPIEGSYIPDDLDWDDNDWRGGFSSSFAVPPHCSRCGGSFPWTERKLNAAIELFVEGSSATSEDEREFEESLREIAKGSPSASLAEHRLTKLLENVPPNVKERLGDILVNAGGGAMAGALLRLFSS